MQTVPAQTVLLQTQTQYYLNWSPLTHTLNPSRKACCSWEEPQPSCFEPMMLSVKQKSTFISCIRTWASNVPFRGEICYTLQVQLWHKLCIRKDFGQSICDLSTLWVHNIMWNSFVRESFCLEKGGEALTVKNDSHWPEIYPGIILASTHHLRCHVKGGTS